MEVKGKFERIIKKRMFSFMISTKREAIPVVIRAEVLDLKLGLVTHQFRRSICEVLMYVYSLIYSVLLATK